MGNISYVEIVFFLLVRSVVYTVVPCVPVTDAKS